MSGMSMRRDLHGGGFASAAFRSNGRVVGPGEDGGEELPSVALGYVRYLLWSAFRHDSATAGPTLRSEIHHPVGCLDHVHVVLDDDDRVALVDEPAQDAEQLADVLEVETGRGLVEEVYRAPGRPLLQLRGELDALCFATGQRGSGLAEPDIAEPDLHQGGQVPADRRDGLEERGGFLDGHVEDLGDGLAFEVDFERLAVVTSAVADLARDIDIREEVHFDLDRAITGACLAAPALDVEREPAGLVAPDLRLGGLGEQPADVVEDTRVGGGVPSRCTADRTLVDVNDLVGVICPGHRPVPAGNGAGAVEITRQRVVEDIVDQRRLA